jgi:hypothetical protein
MWLRPLPASSVAAQVELDGLERFPSPLGDSPCPSTVNDPLGFPELSDMKAEKAVALATKEVGPLMEAWLVRHGKTLAKKKNIIFLSHLLIAAVTRASLSATMVWCSGAPHPGPLRACPGAH